MSFLFSQPGPEDRYPLVGIAKLAAEGESLDEGHQVEYFALAARTVLNRCTTPRMPFAWTINPYRGCEFACKYCYARYTHEFMELRQGVDFERKIYVKQHTGWLLRQELKRVRQGQSIAIGTATDPYQPAERRFEITRAILEEMALHHGLEIGIVTKSNLVVRDLELLQAISKNNRLSVHVTVTTTSADLARILEPRAPRPDLRLQAVRKLVEAGIRTGVNCAPVLPEINDSPAALESVVQAAAAAGARYIFAGMLFLKPCSERVFMPFLEEKFPHLVSRYRRLYGANAYLPPQYRRRISALVKEYCGKYGIGTREESSNEVPGKTPLTEPHQLALFSGGHGKLEHRPR